MRRFSGRLSRNGGRRFIPQRIKCSKPSVPLVHIASVRRRGSGRLPVFRPNRFITCRYIVQKQPELFIASIFLLNIPALFVYCVFITFPSQLFGTRKACPQDRLSREWIGNFVSGVHCAAHVDYLAADIGRQIRSEEQGDLGDVVGRTSAPQRNLLGPLFLDLV